MSLDPDLIPKETHAAALRNHKIGQRLQRIARLVEKELKKAGATKDDTQFSLIIWGEGRMQYVSNAQRSDVKAAMREMVEKWDREGAERGVPEKPLGGIS